MRPILAAGICALAGLGSADACHSRARIAAPAASSAGGAHQPTTSGAGGSKPVPQWVMGYYVGYQLAAYPIADIDWTALTHIAMGPVTVMGNGSLDLSFDESPDVGPDNAKALAQAAHAHGVKALLMLGGDGAGANIAAAAGADGRAAFVSALLGAVDQLGYDGIDLDWEDNVSLDDLIALAQALRTARPALLLTYPAGAININLQAIDPRMATLAGSLDRFNVQTYYPATALTGSGWASWFVSPLSGAAQATPVAIDETLARYAAAGVPTEKLGLGLGFYAICYTGDVTGPRQPTDASQIVGGDNSYPLSAFFAAGATFDQSQDAERSFDPIAREPFLALKAAVNDGHCGQPTSYIAYEDEQSILAKGAFSRANGYGGVIVWTLQQGWLPSGASGGRAPNALMQALRAGFLAP